MQDDNIMDSMTDVFVFECSQQIELLEQSILIFEENGYDIQSIINDIFRVMHTIKGNAAMMMLDDISRLAHTTEDLFYYIREQKPDNIDYASLSGIIFGVADFIKEELEKIKAGNAPDSNPNELIENIKEFLQVTMNMNSLKMMNNTAEESINNGIVKKQTIDLSMQYEATVYFEEDCEMENIRAFDIVNKMKPFVIDVSYKPENILDDNSSAQEIQEHGFKIWFSTEESYEELFDFFNQVMFMKSFELLKPDTKGNISDDKKADELISKKSEKAKSDGQVEKSNSENKSIISVKVSKLNKLMDLMGEMVIAESMVTQHPDLKGINLRGYQKAARHLRKITGEIQDMVMSIRMVPLSTTFRKMNRIVRDMNNKLGKNVKIEIIGEETEVDKNIIEHLSDPLMHLIRNSLDHGVGTSEERKSAGKVKEGKIILEASNEGGDVLVSVKDNGRGLNKEKILKKARENNLLFKPESEMTDQEIYNLIFLPGFSTKEAVTEFSGRGVGMDVVSKNIEEIGGTVTVESTDGIGTTFKIRIPLTLAIIEGMNIRVGKSKFVLPITDIRQSFRPKDKDIFTDTNQNSMIMVRGKCLPIIRLNEVYNIKKDAEKFSDGIIIITEKNEKNVCIFADELIGQQQVVVKMLPNYITMKTKVQGISGCTLMGDGSVSLIMDISKLL